MMNDSIEGILASIPGVQISLSGAGCLKNGALTEPAAFEFQAVSSHQRSRYLIAQIKEPWKYFQKNRGSVLTSLPFHGMMPASLERMILTSDHRTSVCRSGGEGGFQAVRRGKRRGMFRACLVMCLLPPLLDWRRGYFTWIRRNCHVNTGGAGCHHCTGKRLGIGPQ